MANAPTPQDYDDLLNDVANGNADYTKLASSQDPTDRNVASQLRLYTKMQHGFDLNDAYPVQQPSSALTPQDYQKIVSSVPGGATLQNYMSAIPGLSNVERFAMGTAAPPNEVQGTEDALHTQNQNYKNANGIMGTGITPAEVAGGLTSVALLNKYLPGVTAAAAPEATAGGVSQLVPKLAQAGAFGLGMGNAQNISDKEAETGQLPQYQGLIPSALQNLTYAGTGVGGQMAAEGMSAVGRGIANTAQSKVGQILENVPKLQDIRGNLNSLIESMKPSGLGPQAYSDVDYGRVGNLGDLPTVTDPGGLPLDVKGTLNAAAAQAIGGKFGTTFPYLKSNPADLIPASEHPDVLNSQAANLEQMISDHALDENSHLTGDQLTEMGDQAVGLRSQAAQNAADLASGRKNLGEHLLDQQAHVNGELTPVVPAGAVQATNNALEEQLYRPMDGDVQGPKTQFTDQANALKAWMKPVLDQYAPQNALYARNNVLNNIQANIPANVTTFGQPGVNPLGNTFEQSIGIPEGSNPDQLSQAENTRQILGPDAYNQLAQMGQDYAQKEALTNQRLGVVNRAALAPDDFAASQARAGQGAMAGAIGLPHSAAYKLAQAASMIKPALSPAQQQATELLQNLGRQPTAEAATNYINGPISDATQSYDRYLTIKQQLNDLASKWAAPTLTTAATSAENK